MATTSTAKRPFIVQLIKPSHYDDDGYLIQWVKAFVPSNSLACVLALAEDVRDSRALGEEVDVRIDAYDEVHTVVPVRKVIRRIREADGRGMVLLVGVQTNQFPRAAELAKEFRAAGVPVGIGGFHVSGCKAMLPELPPDIRELQDLGVSLFLGEAEGRMAEVLQDAWNGELKPVYDYLDRMPDLEGAVVPTMPVELSKRYLHYTSWDAGRGCPFQCSFCTIINVQGRKSRSRTADDVERIARNYWAQGVRRFFITDDNFARNQNWESILDRLIQLRREEGIKFKFLIQVDTTCHKIPGFIEKAAAAGCKKVFIGLENINPDNLIAVKKRQNKILEYRKMLQAWREQRVLTYAGYILGLPADTPESIARDIRLIQRELPIDILEFMVLTPLPGSEDHQTLHRNGVWMDPDMNKYDLEHVTTRHHEKMTPEQLAAAYDQAWHQYYTPEHMETLIRRGAAVGSGARRTALMIWQFYGSYCIEKVHPLQSGLLRRKRRTLRRPGFPRENPLIFYPRYAWETLSKGVRLYRLLRRLRGFAQRVKREPGFLDYRDRALRPVDVADEQELEMLQPAVEAAERQRQRREAAMTA